MPDDLLIPGSATVRHFDIITGALKAYEQDGRRFLRGTASSTIVDLAGDRMAESALGDMERDAADHMTVFLNHSYNVPEDVFGSITARALTRRDAFVDFDVEMEVLSAEENPRADQAYRAIRDKGVKLGISIGAQVLDAARVKEASADGEREIIEFRAVKLLEASIVGIPCNPRSWVANAVKSFTPELARADDASDHDKAKAAQEARAKQYHIGAKDGGNVTKPSEWSSVPDAEWGDPVNYRYPMPDKTHADNAASRWGDAANRSGYSSDEQAIISRRIEERQSHFGIGQDKEKSLDDEITSQQPQAVVADAAADETAPAASEPVTLALDDLIPQLTRAARGMTHEALRPAMQEIHDHAARYLAMGCAPGMDDGDDDADGGAQKDADPALVKDALSEHQALLDELAAKRAELLAKQAEITRELEAAQALVTEHTALLSGLDARKQALEAEVADLEATRERALSQGTGRPTQRHADATPLTTRDIATMTLEEIAERLREAAA